MGGKQKQAQRTKNNARPSNSGRSAELLGTTLPQFVSFANMKESGFTSAGFSLAPNDDIYSTVDTNFQLVLKKMHKKDSTTKLKALQEFTELTKNTEGEAVKAILRAWARIYCVLCTDSDHKVREATHVAHNQVVLKAKRNLAPILKEVIGPWFTSQYDTYPPASCAAKQAFEDAFPTNKQQDAIIFCQEEILKYVCDNLTLHTAQTYSSAKMQSSDDCKAKYERVLISSLQGYALYLSKVPQDSLKKVEELNVAIISNNKFWKLARHELPPIRSAWFGVITALCQKAPFLLESEAGQLTKAVFANLDETDPSVQSCVWEASLLTVTSINEWWKYISVPELFLPKLWKVIKEAAFGNASTIYPNLLPLISHLPPSINTDEFYPKFFDNLRFSLQHKTAKSSQSESRAISTTLIECLQYAILKNHTNLRFCNDLIQMQLLPIVESCLDGGQSAYKTMFNQISSLVQYWHRNRNHSELKNYQFYLKTFWKNAEILLEDKAIFYADTEKPGVVGEMISKQIEFLMCLKHSTKPKRCLKVKFTENPTKETFEKEPNINCDESYLESLKCLVHSTCILYIRIVNLKKIPEVIENIFALILEFETESLFGDINKIIGSDSTGSLMGIYNCLLSVWMNDKKLCTKSAVDLLFLLFKYLKSEEKAEILEKVNTLKKETCLGWCIARALAHPHNTDAVVQKWLSTESVGNFLVKIIKNEVIDKSTPELSLLLKQAFTETNNGNLFISRECVLQIISVLTDCLLSPSDYNMTIDTCSSLAAYVASIIYTEHLALTYGDSLLLALFTLSCSNQSDNEYLTKDTLWEVSTAWQDAVCAICTQIDKSEFLELTRKFAATLEGQFLLQRFTEINGEDVVERITSFVQSIENSNGLLSGEIFAIFFRRAFVDEWSSSLTSVVQQAEYLRGHLSFPYDNARFDDGSITDENVVKYFMWKNVIASVISQEICNEDDEDDEKSNSDLYVKVLVKPEEFLADLLIDVTIGDLMLKNYNSIKYLDKIDELNKSLNENLFKILSGLDEVTEKNLANILRANVHSKYWLWARVARLYYVDFKAQSPAGVYEDLLRSGATGNCDLGRLHLTQVFTKDLTYDNVCAKLNTIESIITLRSLINCDDIDVQIAEVFGRIEKLRNEEIERFFYNVNFNNWEQTQAIIEIIRLCSSIIMKDKINTLSRRHWDFVVISLGSWSAKLNDVKSNCENIQIASFISSISELFACVNAYIKNLQEEQPNSDHIDEWNNVFVQSITTDLLRTWLYISEYYDKKTEIKLSQIPFLQEFGKVIPFINPVYIFKNRPENMPKWTKLLRQCCALLVSPAHCLQLWGYNMLIVMSPEVINVDAAALGSNMPHEKGMIFEQFKDLLTQTHDIVQTMLLDFKLGEDSCRVEPFTDSYTYTFAYLLLWIVLLDLVEKSSTELRYHYSDWLRKEDLLKSLLSSIYKLMPSEVLHYYDAKVKPLYDWFVKKPSFSLDDPISSNKIERLVCWVYASTLSQLPATVRQWWSNVETRTSQVVERVTTAYVSPHLCLRELHDVAEHETKFKNMTIKVHPSVREVVAVYTVDEAQMELVITLPANYPLGGPDVQCSRQIGGTSHKQWLMQLKMCVLHQNGRIWDALSLWNNNLDKKFDGVEECYICFAVLHPGTYQLPKLSCKTCRKKFHAACLYKWFSTSNKSTCPICRNLF